MCVGDGAGDVVFVVAGFTRVVVDENYVVVDGTLALRPTLTVKYCKGGDYRIGGLCTTTLVICCPASGQSRAWVSTARRSYVCYVAGFELGVVEYGAAIEAFEQAGKPERGLEMFDEMVSRLNRRSSRGKETAMLGLLFCFDVVVSFNSKVPLIIRSSFVKPDRFSRDTQLAYVHLFCCHLRRCFLFRQAWFAHCVYPLSRSRSLLSEVGSSLG